MYYQMGVHPPSNTKVKSWGSSHTQTLAGALAWHLVTSTLISRGRRGTYGTGWRPWVAGVALGDIHLDITSFCVAGVAGVAQMALGGALGLGLGARDAAWQGRHKLTSTVVLCGRCGTDGTGWRAWTWFGRA